MNLTNEQYISVLETEAKILRNDYFNQYAEGTGHFNTAAIVLEHRVNELRNKGNNNEFNT